MHSAAVAWSDDSHVTDRNVTFAQKRTLVQEFLFKNQFEFLKTTSSFYCWVRVPSGFEDGETYCQWLANTCGIIATPGDTFGPTCAGWFRLALVPPLKETKDALAHWEQAQAAMEKQI